MRHILLFLLPGVLSFSINCYYISSFIQEHDVLLYPETEKRFHQLCPTVSTHIVSGKTVYDGVIETLLNRVDDSPIDTCLLYPEEDIILKSIGLSCEMFLHKTLDGSPNAVLQ